MAFEYIKDTYNVPAEYGRKIKFRGDRTGIIVKDCGSYIGVTFDDEKPGNVSNLHPTWEVEYLGLGKVRNLTAGQKRYQAWLSAEYDSDFFYFIKNKHYKRYGCK